MEMSRCLHILFSKALMLTYAFIGYVSLSGEDVPVCVVDSVPVCSESRTIYPSAVSFQVSMNEHVRSCKIVTHRGAFAIIDSFVFFRHYTSITSVYYSYIPPFLFRHGSDKVSRAPPVL